MKIKNWLILIFIIGINSCRIIQKPYTDIREVENFYWEIYANKVIKTDDKINTQVKGVFKDKFNIKQEKTILHLQNKLSNENFTLEGNNNGEYKMLINKGKYKIFINGIEIDTLNISSGEIHNINFELVRFREWVKSEFKNKKEYLKWENKQKE